MFVCLELDTEDASAWLDIDKLLCEEFGLTHILWGVTSGTEEASKFKLPSNMFYGEPSAKAPELRNLIGKEIRSTWKGGFNLMIIQEAKSGSQWAHDNEYSPKLSTSVLAIEEVASREV